MTSADAGTALADETFRGAKRVAIPIGTRPQLTHTRHLDGSRALTFDLVDRYGDPVGPRVVLTWGNGRRRTWQTWPRGFAQPHPHS